MDGTEESTGACILEEKLKEINPNQGLTLCTVCQRRPRTVWRRLVAALQKLYPRPGGQGLGMSVM